MEQEKDTKSKVGRPKTGKYDNLIKDIKKYTEDTEYPILKELCYKKHYNYDYVMQLQRDDEELSQSIKELLYKKETFLEKNGVLGNLSNTMAVFSLKQLGWKDNVEVKTETNIDNITPLIKMLSNGQGNKNERNSTDN